MGLPLVSPARTTDAATPAGSGAPAPFSTDGFGTDGASSPIMPAQASPPPRNDVAGSSPSLVQLATATTTGAAATASTRSLGTRLARVEESVAAIDGKMDRLMRLVAAVALSDDDRAAAASAAGASFLLLPPSPSPPKEEGAGEDEGGDGSGHGR